MSPCVTVIVGEGSYHGKGAYVREDTSGTAQRSGVTQKVQQPYSAIVALYLPCNCGAGSSAPSACFAGLCSPGLHMCTHTCLLIPRTLWALPSGDAMKYPMVKVCSTTVHSARSPPRRPTSNNDRISLAMFTAAMSLPGACEGGGRNDRNSSDGARGGGGACRFWWSLSSATICLFFLSTL